jgi:hypothetical protein
MEILPMNHRVVFEIEHHDETAQAAASPDDYGLLKAMMDWDMNWPCYNPDQYVLGSMRGEILEWLNTNPALRGDNRFGFDQTRTGDLSFTRSLFVEFDARSDALMFKLTWGIQP